MASGPTINEANYLAMLAQLNQGWWPLLVATHGAALAAVGLTLVRRPGGTGRLVAPLLSGLWLSCAVVFFGVGFSRLSPAGYAFAGLFALQALALLRVGLGGEGVGFELRLDGPGVMGGLLILHALLGHPLLGVYLGGAWPELGLLGLDPNPTVIFSLGLLLLSRGRLPKPLLAVPALWCFLGFLLAVEVGVRQDVVLLPAGLTAAALLLPRDLQPAGE